eukprot:1781397-Pyramimonas_sp.AAC.1
MASCVAKDWLRTDLVLRIGAGAVGCRVFPASHRSGRQRSFLTTPRHPQKGAPARGAWSGAQPEKTSRTDLNELVAPT